MLARQDPYVHEIVDYSGILHDVIFARLVTLPIFEGFTARRIQQLPIQPFHLPYLGVYFISEDMPPDGDPNHGTVAFVHEMKLGISVQMAGNDPVALGIKLNEAFWHIMAMWSDQYLMNLLDTYNPHTGTGNPKNMRIEAVTRGFRRVNWGNPSANQETPWAELQYEPVIRYRTYYPPGPFDDLRRMTVKVVPLRVRSEVTPWKVRTFLTEQLREWWVKHNAHEYEIERMETDDGGWAVRYRKVIPRPPHLPPENEVERIIMRYEFNPDYVEPPLEDDDGNGTTP